MRFYETIFIAKPDLGDEALAERVAWVTDILTSNGAQVVNVDQWGKKRLAYRVDKQRYGIYVLVHYESEPPVVSELERNLKLSEDILKYLTVKLEAHEVEKARAAAAKAAEQPEEPPAPEAGPATEAAPEGAVEVAQETASEAPPVTPEEEPTQTPRDEEEEED